MGCRGSLTYSALIWDWADETVHLQENGAFHPTIILITIIVFVVMRLIPGDVCLAILSDGEATFTQEELIECRIELDLNKPLLNQYFDWIGGVLQGDFGNSYWFKAPVMEELADRIPVTVELTIMAMFISVIVAVPLGIVSALRRKARWTMWRACSP